MKKTLLLFSFMIGAVALQAQCTIQNSCTPTGVWCTTPALNSVLPTATETMTYSTVIQITLASSASGNTINNGTITAVTGLPSGLSYSTNPTSGIINGGSSGCILIAGTPAVGSAGNYVVTANMNISSSFGTIPATFTWSLTVVSSIDIHKESVGNAVIVLNPNPATSQVNLTADFHFRHVKIFDALGNIVTTQQTNGLLETSIDLGKLNSGIYFVQVSDGNKSATRKLIKE
jgi:hypothetical protein